MTSSLWIVTRWLFRVVLFIVTTHGSASAQDIAVLSGVVATRTGSEPAVSYADPAPFYAAVRREMERLSARQPGTSWIVRHPVLAGALIGTGGGAALSRVDAIGGLNHDPRVILIGTGAGAWVGLIASAVHKARSGQRVGAGTKAGIVAGAVGLVVLPVLACYGAGGCGGSS